jgi:hypothetical protein
MISSPSSSFISIIKVKNQKSSFEGSGRLIVLQGTLRNFYFLEEFQFEEIFDLHAVFLIILKTCIDDFLTMFGDEYILGIGHS